ncbi:MAG: outer membrane beta-barrel protein [Syntrophotaleaceae bacterium]
MKCRIALFCSCLFFFCQPVIAEELPATQVNDFETKAPQNPYLVPAMPYTESPFVQQSTGNVIGEFIGGKTGYIHPYVGLAEYYTDNLFNADSGREDDFYTRITPGIWVVLPASRYPLRQLSTLNTAPGGLALSRIRTRGKTRIEAYGGYQADIFEHSQFSSQDHVNQKAEGFFRYNFRGGLSMEVLNIYELNRDPYGTGDSDTLDKYWSNLVNAAVSYEISSKTRVEGEYSFFTLSYDRDRLEFRDRDDNSFVLRGYYRVLPKTAALVEYNYINIDYDEEEQLDSDEHRGYLGFEWDQSGKSRWRLMVGAGLKDFDGANGDDDVNLLTEIQFLHRFTPKTYAELRASRTTNETDSLDSDYTLVHRIQLKYYQRFTPRFIAALNTYYENTDYKGDSREDDRIGAGIDLKYTLTNWMALSGGYFFVTRDSDVDGSDYDKNTAYLSLIFSL